MTEKRFTVHIQWYDYEKTEGEIELFDNGQPLLLSESVEDVQWIKSLLNELAEENQDLKKENEYLHKYNTKLQKQPLLFDVQTIPNTMEIMEANTKLEEENEQLKFENNELKCALALDGVDYIIADGKKIDIPPYYEFEQRYDSVMHRREYDGYD